MIKCDVGDLSSAENFEQCTRYVPIYMKSECSLYVSLALPIYIHAVELFYQLLSSYGLIISANLYRLFPDFFLTFKIAFVKYLCTYDTKLKYIKSFEKSIKSL